MATVNKELFQKFQNAMKLPTRQQGDGHEVKVEVREDEEQSVKLQEIIDLLVAAGYFRARIKGLSPFDKVVGGMTWCIESCNIDLDVDLLFKENSTIGQKIALTEKIVAVLPKMKCPHVIEPHQIQGLDFIHIFPVIQWLVKRSMEFRQEISSFVRSYAISQFDKNFRQADKENRLEKQFLSSVNMVREKYRPRRCYKQKNAPPSDISARVQLTLLEYDHRAEFSNKSSKEESRRESQDQGIEKLLGNMTAMEETLENQRLSEEDLEKLKNHYISLSDEIKRGGLNLSEESQKVAIQDKIKSIELKCGEVENLKRELENELRQCRSEGTEIKENQQRLDNELKEYENFERDNEDELKKIEELVILNDTLRSQETQFRQHCKAELSRLKELIEQTKSSKLTDKTDASLDEDIEEQGEMIRQARLQVARVNRRVASLQRRLDDVPDRSELAQYQTRFLELYNQMSSKSKDTKQYYTLYNTLEDTRVYMEKELSLLNSIADGFPQAMQSAEGKAEFSEKFQAVVESVKQSRARVDARVREEGARRDRLGAELQALLDQQRRYVSAVRQLGLECKRQEALREAQV